MDDQVVDFAKALADGTRQRIMRLCCCEWLSVNDIVEQMDVSQPTVSHHLAILRDAGLVHVREDGRQTFYRLDQNRLQTGLRSLLTSFAPVPPAAQAVSQSEERP